MIFDTPQFQIQILLSMNMVSPAAYHQLSLLLKEETTYEFGQAYYLHYFPFMVNYTIFEC